MEAAATLTGISYEKGCCDSCGREIGRVFAVKLADGGSATLGRRCAAKATGYSNVQREADRVRRMAERDACRQARRAELVTAGHGARLTELDAMPISVETGGGPYASVAHLVVCDVLDGADPAMLYRV